MKIFKFGGASVKDAEALNNVVRVLRMTKEPDLVIVVSAMGKMTNALEEVVNVYLSAPTLLDEKLQRVKQFHQQILVEAFQEDHPIFGQVICLFEELEIFLLNNKSLDANYIYDQIVPYGERSSSAIVQACFRESGIESILLDIRDHLRTNSMYREARVDWESTQKALRNAVRTSGIYLTQGFIGADAAGHSTTLGREGSDYTAAILAYCLDAESVTIWKDVPGVLSADPRYFSDAQLLRSLSYQEAIELAFYGASVIHPKTLQPLQRKNIPLYVKSFLDPGAAGSVIFGTKGIDPVLPCFILKKNQVLLSLSSLDFSFMMEEHIGEVFRLLGKNRLKVDVIQNSAISFKVCVEDKFRNLPHLTEQLRHNFQVDFITGVDLFTIRHFTLASIDFIEQGREVLLKQVAGNTAQMVTR